MREHTVFSEDLHNCANMFIALLFIVKNDTSKMVFVSGVAVNLTYAFKSGGRCYILSVLTSWTFIISLHGNLWLCILMYFFSPSKHHIFTFLSRVFVTVLSGPLILCVPFCDLICWLLILSLFFLVTWCTAKEISISRADIQLASMLLNSHLLFLIHELCFPEIDKQSKQSVH